MYQVTILSRRKDGSYREDQYRVDSIGYVVVNVTGNIQTVTIWKETSRIAFFSGPDVQVTMYMYKKE